jgi:predicted ATP-binding protein involved in virulence
MANLLARHALRHCARPGAMASIGNAIGRTGLALDSRGSGPPGQAQSTRAFTATHDETNSSSNKGQSDMRLDSVHLKNYRCHEGLDVAFKPGFNVIVGVNGSGKTSLLNGVCDALAGLTSYISTANSHYRPLDDEGTARLRIEASNGRYRFEPQYPVAISASGEAFRTACVWTVSKNSQVDQVSLSGRPPGQVWKSIKNNEAPSPETGHAELLLPAVAFYRANRSWSRPQPSEMQAVTKRNARTDGYASWWDASHDSSSLQGWVIAKCLERFQISSETSIAFDDIDTDELALVNKALAVAVEDVKGLRYDLKQKSLLVEWLNTHSKRDPTAFESLSDGQRAVIALVADISRRMCLLNPQLGQEVTTKTPGVVLIDELDIHLHPRWQRIVTSGLKAAFPAVQFIVASHSPQVLGELSPEEIILLRPGGTDHPQVSYGLDSSSVLEEIMGAPARPERVEEALSELFASLERNELDIARQRLKMLRDLAPGIAEIDGAEALLKRKEVLGR